MVPEQSSPTLYSVQLCFCTVIDTINRRRWTIFVHVRVKQLPKLTYFSFFSSFQVVGSVPVDNGNHNEEMVS